MPYPADAIRFGSMTPEIRTELEILELLQGAVDFAYEQGLHEHGIPLVQMVREKLSSLHQALQAERSSRERAERIIQDVTDVAEDFSNFAYDDLPGAVRIMAAIIRQEP